MPNEQDINEQLEQPTQEVDTTSTDDGLQNTEAQNTTTSGVEDTNTEVQDTPDPRITRANKEAASYRTQLREAQKQNQELEAKFQKLTEGLALLAGGDKPAATPEEQLAAAQAERDAAHAKLQEYALNNAVQAAATKAGVDPKLVLPLLKGTGGLDGLDPNSDTFTTTIAERLDALATQFPQVKPQPAKSSQLAQQCERRLEVFRGNQFVVQRIGQGGAGGTKS